MISIRALADEVGYSFSTVSRALKDDPAIKASTRDKIHEAANRLGYRPNALVRGVTGRHSCMIAMIISSLNNGGLARQVSHTSDFLRAKGYPLIILNSDNDPVQERDCFHLAVDYRVAGVILNGAVLDSSASHFAQLINSNIPFVITKEYSPQLNVPHVYRHDREAIEQVVAEAVALGHRHFAHIAGPKESLKNSVRLQAYRMALSKMGFPLSEDAIYTSEWSSESAEHATLRLLGEKPQTTFIFAANDVVAAGVYRACYRTHRRIPDDISVLGSGNQDIGKSLYPSLCTLDPKLKEIAIASCNLLFEMINQPSFSYANSDPSSVTIPGAYLPRQSIGPVKAAQTV
ncbi:MAG: LacI family DNA-binding transcriptional regulator [Verrucomicrobiota bacterium JB024]|nr:LacI family DNA-binding transcriptional regulator [Verrucomicrobiota bacterium JB024]